MELLKSELNQKAKTLKEFNKLQSEKFALVLNRPKYTNENQQVTLFGNKIITKTIKK